MESQPGPFDMTFLTLWLFVFVVFRARSQRRGVEGRVDAERGVTGGTEAEDLGGEGVVVLVTRRGVDELLAVPEDEERGGGAGYLVVVEVVVGDHRHRVGRDPQVVAGHEQVKVELD